MPKLSLAKLERFDCVIANPPFSQNYTKSNMEFPERFRWGWCPTTGKKGDLMFAQHMLAVCKPNGVVITVMPHGVLFRGGAEKEIRKKFLEQDLIEAIIGLPPNLFYGAGIPACVLVMRPNLIGQLPNLNKPEDRRGQVLFINADAEFHAGRAQNYLRPEHVEKIVSTFDHFEDVPGYARRVPVEEIGSPANDWNLNIRRYVDNSPPPEPHDVRAHLLGGVPIAEVHAKQGLFEAMGFNAAHAFAVRENDLAYIDFGPTLTDRSAIRTLVENDADVQARVQALREALAAWWAMHAPRLADLPKHRELNRVRTEFLDTFVAALLSLGVLDRFKLAGVIATWWTDTLPDFKTLLENGFPGVIDGWIDAIADAVEDDEATGPAFDPFGHKLVRHTMSDYLERIATVLDTVDEAIAKTEAVIGKLKQVRAGVLHDLLTRGLDEHGQLRDSIAHPEQFQDSPLGRIPREWTIGFLDGTVRQPSDLTIGPFGSNLLASDYKSEGVPVVFVRDIRKDGFIWSSNIYVSEDKANELRTHSVFAGDVLITKMGLPPCIAAVYPNTMPRGVVTADVIRLRPQVDVVTSFWLALYINSPRFAACVRQITGGVTRPKVTLADFRKQPVLLPSIEEQDRIKNIIMAVAHGIDEVEAELQKLLMLKSGLMTDLLTGRVRVPEHFGVRRHDATLPSPEESGDTSPHSKSVAS